jgi:N-acetylneuraminate synthase
MIIGRKCFIVAEIGINHNGDIRIAKRLIKAAKDAGCDAVKFQKKTVDSVYTKEALDKPQKSLFGETFRDLKLGLEFGQKEYEDINIFCRRFDIVWFASCWDKVSVDFIYQFKPPLYKIASPCLINDELLRYTTSKKIPIILSTGMSTEKQISHAINVIGRRNIINIMHCTSCYPTKPEELNLSYILKLKENFGLEVGYSNHNPEIIFCLAAVALGAKVLEFHITLDRAMWGVDQTSSLEPQEAGLLIKYIREIEKSLGEGIKKIYNRELTISKKLKKHQF